VYTVAMDMDGVVYPFEDAFNALYTELGGEYQPFDHWIDFGTLPGDKIAQVWGDPRLFQSQDPYPGAVAAINQILELQNTQMFFATSFGRRAEAGVITGSKLSWVKRWWPEFDTHNFIAIHVKWLLATDMIVDDLPDHVRKWMNYNPGGTGVLIRRPWNESKLLQMSKKGDIIIENVVEGVLPIIIEKRALKESKGE